MWFDVKGDRGQNGLKFGELFGTLSNFNVDTSITFTGLFEELAPDGSVQVVADNDYLLFA